MESLLDSNIKPAPRSRGTLWSTYFSTERV